MCPHTCLHFWHKSDRPPFTGFLSGLKARCPCLDRVDVLVCTTIIETGLDISNANTIIIENADAMGLAQLYQLRGRVGRGQHQSYCVLISDTENEETLEAVLAEYNELRLISECHKRSRRYPTIKKWFLDKYPQIAEFGMEKEESVEAPKMEVITGMAEQPSATQQTAA